MKAKEGRKETEENASCEFSMEYVEQICSNIMELGRQYIYQIEDIPFKVFKTEMANYYIQLNRHTLYQMMDIEKSKFILKKMEEITEYFRKEMNEAENSERRRRCKQSYKEANDKLTSAMVGIVMGKVPYGILT